MKKYVAYGAPNPEKSQREFAHEALARRAAAEGFVLLKNDGALPLQTRKIALYGPGSRMTVKGGLGSGDVRERHSVSIEEGLKNAGFSFPTTLWMDRFEGKYRDELDNWKADVEEKIKGFSPIQSMKMFDVIHSIPQPLPACTPILEDELTEETDTAVYVLARQAGEGGDRRCEQGDYLLSDIEEESLKLLSAHYKRLILILNCGSVIDLSILEKTRIDAVLFYAQGGMEGGNALADVLTGKVNPSGRLTDTWAFHYEDYPCSDTFGHRNGDLAQEDYRENIYVGYRYFDSFGVAPRYPFGYGLSYTGFSVSMQKLEVSGPEIALTALVKNTGSCAGREVVQLYLCKPQIPQGCEVKSLAAFRKTSLLDPGQQAEVTLQFDIRTLSVYDEARTAFVLPQGEYGLLLGSSAADTEACAVLTVEREAVVEEAPLITPAARSFPVMSPKQASIVYDPTLPRFSVEIPPMVKVPTAAAEDTKIQAQLERLTDAEKISLVVGGGYKINCYNSLMGAAGRTSTELLKKGIPNIVLSDGPAGLNVVPCTAVASDGSPRFPDGLPEEWKWGWLKKYETLVKHLPGKHRKVYRYMTAWPSETLLAQSWDAALLEEVGAAIGREMLEIGVSVWLAPGLNIHRNPLCGRNFEYYSEDPLISGKMAAAVTKGVQSVGGVGVSVKHFCCNNQEDNRMEVSSNVPQRALREIYLRAFRIAITEGKPWTVMSCYNRVNGLHVCNNPALLDGVLRREWGFEGLVMSDWTATNQCSHAAAINAGNDLIMPGDKGVRKALTAAWKAGTLDKAALNRSAARMLHMIFCSAAYADFVKEK